MNVLPGDVYVLRTFSNEINIILVVSVNPDDETFYYLQTFNAYDDTIKIHINNIRLRSLQKKAFTRITT